MNRKPGDWTCRPCQYLNFSRRDSCQRCGDPRPSSEGSDHASFGGGGGRGGNGNGRGGGGSSFGFACSDVRPGDWYCSCGAHNFASRPSCFKCTAPKEDSAVGSGVPDGDTSRSRGYGGRAGWKSGDWICNSCNEHNFASRTECFRCSAPRDSGKEEI